LLLIGCITCSDNLIDSRTFLVGLTDKNEYESSEEINYSITNFSNSTSYVQFCGPYTLNWIEKKSNNCWKLYFAPAIPADCGLVSVRLEPKSNIKWKIAAVDVPGSYRIVIPANTDSVISYHDKIYTNEFVVKN
jgi:hypothetical protein